MANDIGSLIAAKAAQYGEDAEVAKAIAHIESRGRNVPARPGHSAAGVYQFIPSTWKQYGNGADVNDVEANVDAGIRLLRDNRTGLKKALGRDPTPGELYLAHQQGLGGATALLSNPDARASDIVKANHIASNGGWDGMTARQFSGLWSNKMTRSMGADLSGVLAGPGNGMSTWRTTNTGISDDPTKMSVPATRVQGYGDLWTPPETSGQDQRMAHRESTVGLLGLTADAFNTSTLMGSILRAGSLSGFDPSATPYRMTNEDLKARMERLSPSYADWFAKAVSPEHADAIEQAAMQHQKASEELAAAGWGGTALSLTASLLDPVGLAVGVATGGLGTLAAKSAQLGTASRIALNAGIGAGANVAVDKAIELAGDPEHHSPVVSALAGALFGGAYGALSRSPIADDLVRGARRDIETINRKVGGTAETPRTGPDPTPEKPEVVTPTGGNTGVVEIDEAIQRTRIIDADGAAADEWLRRIHERQRETGERAPAPTPPEPKTPGNDNTVRVATQVVNEDPRTRQIAQFVEELAAKFGITKLIRVGAVDRYPDSRLRGQNPYGVATPWHDGSYGLHIDVSGRIPLHAQIETVTHEFGHILDLHYGHLKGAGAHDRDGLVRANANIEKAYGEWRKRASTQSMEDYLKEYFGPAMQKVFGKSTNQRPAREAFGTQWGYRTSRSEWFAQEVAKWGASTEEPLKITDKIWKKVGDYWRKLYFIATGKRPEAVPSEAVRDWIKGIYNDQAIPDRSKIGAAASAALEGDAAALTPSSDPLIYVGRPTLSSGKGLSGINEGDVARTRFGGGRFSIAAETGRSDNPAVRALGAALFEDAPGKQGGAINGQSAELWAAQRTKAAQTYVAQSRTVAFDKWAEENGVSWWQRGKRAGEFEEQVSLAIRADGDAALTQNLSPAVKQYAAHLHKIMEDARKLAENPFHEEGLDGRPVRGFGAIKEDARYLTRVFSAAKISAIVNDPQHGYGKLTALVRGAIQSAQPGLPDRILDRLSSKFTENIYKRAHGVIDEKVARMFAADDLASLKRDLIETHGLSQDDADEVVRGLKRADDAGVDSRAKHRVVMDENYELDGLKLSDILVNNATALTNAYLRHMYGKTSLARVRVKDAEGKLLVNGITDDGEWRMALASIRDRAHDAGVPKAKTDAEIEALQAGYDQLVGVPHHQHDKNWAKSLRLAQKFNLIRLGHQFTFAQMGEAYNLFSEVGLGAVMQQVPSFKRIITADGRSIKAHGLDDEIESIFGLGADRLRQVADVRTADDLHSLPMEASGFLDRANEVMDKAAGVVMAASGFHIVDGAMKQWAAKAIAQKFANMAARAKKLPDGTYDTSHANYPRMAQLGLDKEMLGRVISEVQGNFSRERGILFGNKVTRMNLDKWGDQEARIAFEGALMRYSRRIIQENDIGSMHKWMSHPLWRMMTQFRAFPIHAWDKQLMFNAAMHDSTSAVTLALGAAVPTMIYAVQTNLQAVGRSDADAWKEKRLEPKALISAAIQRHGWSSMMPAMIDTAMPFIGQHGVFDARTTQQASDPLLGNPTVSLVTDAAKASAGFLSPIIDGRQRSQDESRAIARMFGNNLIATMALNSMISDQPLHAPRQNNGR